MMNLGTCGPRALVLALLLLSPLEAWAVGGNSCATATFIGSLPYVNTGNTCTFDNWYDEHCAVHSASSDVVYVYSPATDQCVDITLCGGTSFDTKLYVYASDSGGCPAIASDNTGLQIACNDDACPAGSLVSEIVDLPMGAGRTYWIVVDGSGDDCGNYQIAITAIPLRSCPARPCTTHAECDDGLFCNGPDSCQNGFCVPGADPCAPLSCDEAIDTCLCVTAGDCDDGDTCTADDCVAGSCVHSPAPGCCTCDAECDDNNTCTEDECCEGLCTYRLLSIAFPCGDGNPCTEHDACDASGTCVGTPIDCSDLDDDCNAGVCTLQGRSPLHGQAGTCAAVPANEGGPCSNGPLCMDDNSCTAGLCTGGTPRNCDDGDVCTDDSCDPTTDLCVHTPIPGCCHESAECNDGLYCNGLEFCSAPPTGTCQPGVPVDCDDGDPCTVDRCVEEDNLCSHELVEPCCRIDADCDDRNDCTNNVCAGGQCENLPVVGQSPCGDQGVTACSDPDTCDGEGACQPNNVLDGAPCDDNNTCTDGDQCSAGICAGTSNGTCATCGQGGSGDDPTNQIGFQASLRDANGDLVQGNVDLRFQFYADEEGLLPVGGPVDQMVAIPVDAAGVVSTTIPITETIFDGSARWLGVRVNYNGGQEGEDLRPLLPVNSVPQAFRVGCASGEELSDVLRLGGSQSAGELHITGPGPGGRAESAYAYFGTLNLNYGSCGWVALMVTGPAQPTAQLAACTSAGQPHGSLTLRDSDGNDSFELQAQDFLLGTATLKVRDGNDTTTVLVEGDTQESNGGGRITVYSGDSDESVILRTTTGAAGGGWVQVLAADGKDGMSLSASSNGGSVEVYNLDKYNATQEVATLDATHYDAGRLRLRNDRGLNGITLEASHYRYLGVTGGSLLSMDNYTGETTVEIRADTGNDFRSGQIKLSTPTATTVEIVAQEGKTNNGAQIRLSKANGTATIILDAEHGNGGPGRVITQQLQITAGSDLSEQFDVAGPTEDVKPGMVVSIDPKRPGKLIISNEAYDYRVAGIISGAGGLVPGMLMGQSGSEADGEYPVALSGRVYCWADATHRPIQPGDLLTTSDTPGHAMKVTSHTKAQGAIIGKAMTSLENGMGLVLVLVSLQ